MNLFARLGPIAYRYRWPILAFWVVVLVTAAFFAPKLGGQLKGGGFEGSGRDSELAKDLMVEELGVVEATTSVSSVAAVAPVSPVSPVSPVVPMRGEHG